MGRRLGELAALAVLLCGLAALSCTGPSVSAFGESDDLVIVRENGATEPAAERLAALLEAELPWLVNEGAFRTTVVTPEEFRRLTNRRHILLLGTWDDDQTSELVRARVGALEPGAAPSLRIVEDIWAKGQVVGAMMADTTEELIRHLDENGEDVLLQLQRAVTWRLARTLAERASEGGALGSLKERFGWSLSPPSGYDFITTHADAGFVFFRRTRPDRTIFVYWQPGVPEDVTEEFITTRRSALAARYYDGDEIEWRRELIVEAVEFQGRPAISLSGWWGNRELVGGGPFKTYCFHEASQGRVYLLDASLFAPGLDKMSLMRNLDAALHTFDAAVLPES